MKTYTLFVFVFLLECFTCGQDTGKDSFNPPPSVYAQYPYYLSGFDVEGAPVWIFKFGAWDVRSATLAGYRMTSMLITHSQHMLERIRDSGRSAGDGYVLIMDVGGYDFRQASHEPATKFWTNFFKYYGASTQPGDVKSVYVINSSPYFKTLWKASTFTLGRLKNRFRFFDEGSDLWKSVLARHIPPGELPPLYGGNNLKGPLKVYG